MIRGSRSGISSNVPSVLSGVRCHERVVDLADCIWFCSCLLLWSTITWDNSLFYYFTLNSLNKLMILNTMSRRTKSGSPADRKSCRPNNSSSDTYSALPFTQLTKEGILKFYFWSEFGNKFNSFCCRYLFMGHQVSSHKAGRP